MKVIDYEKSYKINRNGCWIWTRGKTTAGYGETCGTYAHRICYEQYKGKIPEKCVIDHLCRTPPCVNPVHLEAVPNHVNIWRSNRRRFSDEQIRSIKERKQSGETYKVLGLAFKTHTGYIAHICKGRRWGNLGT